MGEDKGAKLKAQSEKKVRSEKAKKQRIKD